MLVRDAGKSRTAFRISISNSAIRSLRYRYPHDAMIATPSPRAAGTIDAPSSSAIAAIQVDLSAPQGGNEWLIPQTAPIIPANGAVAATVARPHKPRAICRSTITAARSAACWAEATRQSILE